MTGENSSEDRAGMTDEGRSPGDGGAGEGSASPRGETDDGFEIDPASLTKEEVRELLEKARAADEYLEKLQYSLASFQNFRKRTEKEKEEWHKYGISNLVVDLQESYKLAASVAPHVDKIRYNPGHLHHHEKEKPTFEKVRRIVEIARDGLE